MNNPLRFIDPTGMGPDDPINGGTLPEVTITAPPSSNFSDFGNFLWGAVDYLPFLGSGKQIGVGIYNGDLAEVGLGLVFLGVDIFTAGEGGEALRVAEAATEDILKIAAEDEIKEIAEHEAEEITYQTYTKTHPETGEVYSGRTSGKGMPNDNVAKRDIGHHMNEKGFGPAELDKSSKSSDAIRGREQQLIEHNGGAKSGGGISGNKINGISPKNPKIERYLKAARDTFGEIPKKQ
ncbi:hypothetical protein SAMN05216436_1211 [bacterium A37T11]|nr:hypothetical protein SAMN05216436_1211 [bacterium A37T11]